MRALPVVAAGLSIGLTAAATGLTAFASSRQASFAHRASALEQRWKADTAAGAPAASLAPLRTELAHSTYETAPSWSPQWWFNAGQSVLDNLESRTTRAWTAALEASRAQAAAVFTSWNLMSAQLSPFVPANAVTAEQGWLQELAAAATPLAVDRLIALWSDDINAARRAALQNQLNAEVSAYRGVSGLLAQADSAVAKAHHDNLDPGQVPTLTTTLRTELSTHSDDTATTRALLPAVQSLHSLIRLNNNVAAALPPLMY